MGVELKNKKSKLNFRTTKGLSVKRWPFIFPGREPAVLEQCPEVHQTMMKILPRSWPFNVLKVIEAILSARFWPDFCLGEE